VHSIIVKSLLTNDIFKYEGSEDVDCDKQSAQMLQFGQCVCAAEILRQLVENMTVVLLMYRCGWPKIRTRIIVVPGERRMTGGSRAWP